ncbi:YybH family protein [Agromyces arachidis]|uniref:YybH family protein n=1 Tax=Agromyces arachidis TaxID=766966 RepID=UPI0040574529
MNDREEFLNWVYTSLAQAERALFDGDAGPRKRIWSSEEPVSVLGAWRTASNRPELVEAFEVLATSFSDCTNYAIELVTWDVRGDLAYTVGYERVSTTMDGTKRDFTIRATQVYRREADGWKVVHRHADAISSAV